MLCKARQMSQLTPALALYGVLRYHCGTVAVQRELLEARQELKTVHTRVAKLQRDCEPVHSLKASIALVRLCCYSGAYMHVRLANWHDACCLTATD